VEAPQSLEPGAHSFSIVILSEAKDP